MRLTPLLVLLAILAGCTPYKHVVVNAWSDGTDVSKKPYCLVPSQDIVPGDLEFSQFAAYARRVLDHHGYTETTPDKAELTITLSYGVGGRSEPYFYAEPYYESGTPRPRYVNPQQYSVMGTEGSPGVLDNYIRFVKMAAYDKGVGASPGPQRWRMDVISPGTGTDLRLVVPYMMAGACDYIGQDTGRKVNLTIYQKDPRYKLVTASGQ
jgi:hypothetical protein